MNEIEKIIDEYEIQLQAILDMFEVDDPKKIPDKAYQWSATAIVCFLKSLKNLPNELRAVNRNEAAKEFINSLLDNIHNINPELAEERTKDFYKLNL